MRVDFSSPIFSELEVSSTRNKHPPGALRPQAGPEHLLLPLGRADVDAAWAQATSALGLSVFTAVIADPAEEKDSLVLMKAYLSAMFH